MPIFFNVSINDLLCFIENVSSHNISDENTLPAWAKTLSNVIKLLVSEINKAVNWFTKK